MPVIRSAADEDIPAIVDIHNALLHTTTYEWTEVEHRVEDWRQLLIDKRTATWPMLVYEDRGMIAGWATYGDFRDSAHWPGYRFVVEHSIHIARAYWGKGIGRQLMSDLIQKAQAAGKRVMVGAIDSTNERSLRFHELLGFVEVARMPGVGDKWGRRLDLVLVQRHIDQSA